MYHQYYGLTDEPFRLTPDSRFFHFSEPHQNALRVLLEGIFYRKGLVMITGPIGTGKTTLVHTALQIFNDKKMPVRSALLFNPTLSREEFLEMMLDEFEVKCAATASKPKQLMALQHMLLDTQRRGGTSVLFIDEAHLLSPELLEEIRLLGNADTHQEKLLQIVLSGQPELLTIMRQRELSALQQRIAARAILRPLSQLETQAYVTERLRTAGLQGASPFTTSALVAVHEFTGGVPRLINLNCEESLSLGYRKQRTTIDIDIVEEAASALGLVEEDVAIDGQAYIAAPSAAAPIAASAPHSMVDTLIEAMKTKRSTTQGVAYK